MIGLKKWKVLILMIVVIFVGNVSVFSQEILASFGIGGQFLDTNRENKYGKVLEWSGNVLNELVVNGFTYGINIMFIGKIGYTISAGIDIVNNPIDPLDGGGANLNTIFGLGYVYYSNFYIGGILNFIYNPHLFKTSQTGWSNYSIFLTPTIVGGYNFKNIFIGGQISYMYDIVSTTSGFRFSINTGVNLIGK